MKTEKMIYLKDVDDVNEFVTQAGKCDFPITVKMKHARLNAKSFMGMISQVTGRKVKIEYNEQSGKQKGAFDKLIRKYGV